MLIHFVSTTIYHDYDVYLQRSAPQHKIILALKPTITFMAVLNKTQTLQKLTRLHNVRNNQSFRT